MIAPEINITNVEFKDHSGFIPNAETAKMASISYQISETDYMLIASGEGESDYFALQNALESLAWSVALHSDYRAVDIAILKAAHDLYLKNKVSWHWERTLMRRSQTKFPLYVESNPVRQLAKFGLLNRHLDDYGVVFQLSEMGLEVILNHAQFK